MGFEAETRTVQEDGGSIFVDVTIAQEISQPVTLDIVFVDGSAVQQSGKLWSSSAYHTLASNKSYVDQISAPAVEVTSPCWSRFLQNWSVRADIHDQWNHENPGGNR